MYLVIHCSIRHDPAVFLDLSNIAEQIYAYYTYVDVEI